MTAGPSDPVPWYRVPMVWLLIALPLSAVVGGFITLWLALRSDDGLVVDDYYRRGIEINRDLDRDQAARARDITARLQLDDARREMRIDLNLPATQNPAQLQVQLQHATRQGYDLRFVAVRDADGAYLAPLTGLAQGHYYVQLAADDWRLLGSFRFPGESQVEIKPVAGSVAR
jgi:uncharacterized protein